MEFHQTSSQRSGVQMILQTIKDYGPISKRELQELTGLSWGHISQVTNRFLNEGYIVVEDQQLTAGRTRDLLDINREDNYFIGVDLNSKRVRAIVIDMKGRVVCETRKGWDKAEREVVLKTIFTVIDSFVNRFLNKRIIGIGFAVQGIVDVMNGISVAISSIHGWTNVPLKKLVEERYEVDVVIAHDPDCVMKYECNSGVLKNSEVQNAVTIIYTYGMGIGTSLMINGQIYLGAEGRVGELDHTILGVDKDGWHEMLGQHIAKCDSKIDMKELGDYIGRSVAMLNSFLNPEMIVMHMAEPDYREEIFEAVQYNLKYYSYNKDVVLKLSAFNKNVKAIGAALLLVDREIDQVM